MSQRERTSVIAEFQDPSPDSPRVLLLSLRAGGVGLNLTAANKMVLIDPAWNPATEDQCFDRYITLTWSRSPATLFSCTLPPGFIDLDKQETAKLSNSFTRTGLFLRIFGCCCHLNLSDEMCFFFSIEERMMAIQEKKKDLISGAFQQTAAERRQQRIQDIRDIFGI